jgi:hypothetical protein
MNPRSLKDHQKNLEEAQKAEAAAKLKLDSAIAEYRAAVSFTSIVWRDYQLQLMPQE